ncbi:hypothetical protein K503DRAFT_857735 [Rhizopogon vinicolor AM-OR11-026]|uniref:Uncharacterized protein n=1 Tax=Rhizopogon vinicolor AM-OR11-026 TaxID=1314800 RepID=A0A1B7MW92_9AGAM|nr:hypothetical protein K503DRAFT_857735 [Rhizopogon vinicolor AM-OR11-026]
MDNVHIWDCEVGLLVGEPWKGKDESIRTLLLSPDAKDNSMREVQTNPYELSPVSWQSKGNTLRQQSFRTATTTHQMQISLLLFIILSSIHRMVVNRSSVEHLTAISELKSERTATSARNLKDTQAKGTTTVKPSNKCPLLCTTVQLLRCLVILVHFIKEDRLVRAVLSRHAHVVNKERFSHNSIKCLVTFLTQLETPAHEPHVISSSSRRPLSAIFPGSLPPNEDNSILDLPEVPERPGAASTSSGLPSPSATNSMGSGSTGDNKIATAGSLRHHAMKNPNKNLVTLRRVKSLTQPVWVMNKLSCLSTPSPVNARASRSRFAPVHASSSASSSSTASSHSHSHSAYMTRQYDGAFSGSETERETTLPTPILNIDRVVLVSIGHQPFAISFAVIKRAGYQMIFLPIQILVGDKHERGESAESPWELVGLLAAGIGMRNGNRTTDDLFGQANDSQVSLRHARTTGSSTNRTVEWEDKDRIIDDRSWASGSSTRRSDGASPSARSSDRSGAPPIFLAERDSRGGRTVSSRPATLMAETYHGEDGNTIDAEVDDETRGEEPASEIWRRVGGGVPREHRSISRRGQDRMRSVESRRSWDPSTSSVDLPIRISTRAEGVLARPPSSRYRDPDLDQPSSSRNTLPPPPREHREQQITSDSIDLSLEYEPSPTPAARNVAGGRHGHTPALPIPPPLATLPSESLLHKSISSLLDNSNRRKPSAD